MNPLWRRVRTHLDWPLLLCVLVIAAIGLVTCLLMAAITWLLPTRGGTAHPAS